MERVLGIRPYAKGASLCHQAIVCGTVAGKCFKEVKKWAFDTNTGIEGISKIR